MSNSDELAKAILEGRRGPGNEVALLGSSNYMSQVLKPHRGGNHAKSQLLQVSSSLVESRGRPTSAGGGLVPPPSVPGASTADFKQATSQALREALDQTKKVFEAAAPVHVRDLAATAEAKTKELTDREREVLRYQVFTQEEVPNNPPEPLRTRVLELSYYTSDGSLRLYEPQLANSGLLQGPFARRHVATDPSDGHAYGPMDFQIGSSVTIYGRKFTFTDADQHTRTLLKGKYGLNLAPAIPTPTVIGGNVTVPFHVPRTNTVAFDMNKEEDPKRGFFRKAGDTRAKFMQEGAAMLRFEGEWCENGAPFSDRRRFAIQYHLSDDTMEILDRTSPYSSGGLFSKFLSRQRLPRMPVDAACASMLPLLHKDWASQLILPNAEAVEAACGAARSHYDYSKGRTMRAKFTSPITGRPAYTTGSGSSSEAGASDSSSVVGGTRLAGVPVTSSLGSEPEFITAADLICGGVISVYGRPLLLRSCDPFTVAFGLHSFCFDQRDLFVKENPAANEAKTVPLPPHVGALALGSEEETRKNASKLIPTYRKARDFERYYQLGSKALRFQAILDPSRSDPEDSRRRFVISYYLEDNTLSIGEMTGNRPGHGPSVLRWLNRGRYRNPNAPPDAEAMAALGIKQPLHGAIPPAVAAAYDRVYGVARDKIGYTESSGAQGYGGGIFGKAERVGAGGVGVGESDGIGIRDPSLHSMEAISRYYDVNDFKPGALIQLPHLLGVAFILTKPDSWTASFLAAREADPTSDPKDIFVPENSTPVPAMPLEASAVAPTAEEIAASGGASPVSGAHGGPSEEEAEEEQQFHNDCLLIAKILSGVMESAKLVIRQSDKHNRGYAPKPLVMEVLRRYGVQEPACSKETVERVLQAFTIDFDSLQEAQQEKEAALAQGFVPSHLLSQQRPAGGSPGDALNSAGKPKKTLSRTTFGVGGVSAGADSTGMVFPQSKQNPYKSPSIIGTMEDPLSGPFLRDFASHEYSTVPMIDFPALFNGLHSATTRQLALQPRIDKLLSQLRTALLSSRTQLRRVFRDLDVHGCGAITMSEFRKMLARHTLDVGISDAQMRVLLRRFEPASPQSLEALQRASGVHSINEPCISWDGFVRALLEVETLSPDELATFLTFVKGLRDSAQDGVGSTRAVPQLKPHLNAVSSWSHEAADPTGYLSAAAQQPGHVKGFGAIVEARLMRPSTAPSSGSSGATNASFTVIDARRPQTAAAPMHAAPAAPPSVPSVPSTRSGSIVNEPSAPVEAAHPPGSSPAVMSKAQARVTFGKDLESSVPSHAVASTFVKAPKGVATVDILSALSSRPDTARIVTQMKDAFGRKRFDLYRALSLYDTNRKNVLTVPSFIAAVTSAGLKLSRSELEAFQGAVSAEAGGQDLADCQVDFGHFFDNLWANETHYVAPSSSSVRPRTAAPSVGAY